MAGNRAGGKAAAKTNKIKYGKNFYGVIGHTGGSVSHPETRYFFRDREAAKRAGALGGRISKRTKKET